jgi:DNA-binding CsgD family transcriptional regulator
MKEARKCYEELLRSKTLDGHQYAIEASSLGYTYKYDQEPELATQMLIRAAIADIQASIKETVAIRNLAETVYKKGDNKRAYNYVKVALDDAYFYGARHRKVQISDILPNIEDRQLEIVMHQRKTFLIYSLSITVLSLLVILFIFIIFRQLRILNKAKKYLSEANKRLSEINRNLLEANLIKEEYIGHFFDTISEYINRFEKIKINVNRKITTHQIEDIKDIIATIDIKQEREQFYISFDSIFLKIFPDFVEAFNQFLKDDQLISNSKHMLTPEIRIYALLRLGISDNDKIARFLGYSLNTIYSYKTRIKNRLTIPIDEFEKKLMSIKTI